MHGNFGRAYGSGTAALATGAAMPGRTDFPAPLALPWNRGGNHLEHEECISMIYLYVLVLRTYKYILYFAENCTVYILIL